MLHTMKLTLYVIFCTWYMMTFPSSFKKSLILKPCVGGEKKICPEFYHSGSGEPRGAIPR